MDKKHIPVLCDEVLEFLKPESTGTYVDGTIGLGGHSLAVLSASAPDGQVIGIDLDPEALALAKERLHAFGDRCCLINGNFSAMPVLLAEHSICAVDGILLDLGVSSLQLDTPHRGFSFNHTGPLDMRMEPDTSWMTIKKVSLQRCRWSTTVPWTLWLIFSSGTVKNGSRDGLPPALLRQGSKHR